MGHEVVALLVGYAAFRTYDEHNVTAIGDRHPREWLAGTLVEAERECSI
jgi:hypothetical protein